MTEPSLQSMATTAMNEHSAEELKHAFHVFNQVSLELTQAYDGLQRRAAALADELAIANGELRRQYLEKEALSERLGLLLNALPAGVIVLSSDACVREANPAALDMFGAALLGVNWPALAQSQLLPCDVPDEWQLGLRRVSIAESPLDSAGGRLLLLHDITAAHALKVDVERSQRLAAMGEMAASLVHQLRTPLATALLYSANLAQANLSDSARVRFSDKATEQLRRLERLIQDVLLFARGERLGRDSIVVAQWVAEAAQTLAPLCVEKGVTFSVDSALGDSIIVGNAKALSSALLNLLENALQACSRGGKIVLTARVLEQSVQLSVRDSGVGVAFEAQARIFDPFFTTRAEGSGLGLAIALGVARAHGGTIEIHSPPGQGAEFLMRLPAGLPSDLSREQTVLAESPGISSKSLTASAMQERQ
ncbi:MAG: ATP-binding protein [Pseudomonadota bacterium]